MSLYVLDTEILGLHRRGAAESDAIYEEIYGLPEDAERNLGDDLIEEYP
jgi:hypothetical protein